MTFQWLPWLLVAVLAVVIVVIYLEKYLRRRAATKVRETRGQPPIIDDDAGRVLSVLRSAAIVLDADGEVVSATPSAYSQGLIRGDEIVTPALRDLVAQVRTSGRIVDQELETPRQMAGAAPLLLRVRAAPIGKGRVLILPESSTESHSLDTIRRDFVENVSHELKTPVAAITLLAETIQSAATDPEAVAKFSGQLRTEVERLSGLVSEIIQLSRVQASGALPDVTTVVLSDVIAEAVEREAVAARAKNIQVVTAGADDVLVFGDQALLVTAVRNLLDNAILYSPANTRVGIGVKEEGGLVEIAVVDQGIGISAAEQPRVFERFYRTDPARSRVSGGTGLGLSIVKHIAADHGGDISVWSTPGRGSTFTLRVPAAEGAGFERGSPAELGVTSG